jgi:hypothetical protein
MESGVLGWKKAMRCRARYFPLLVHSNATNLYKIVVLSLQHYLWVTADYLPDVFVNGAFLHVIIFGDFPLKQDLTKASVCESIPSVEME